MQATALSRFKLPGSNRRREIEKAATAVAVTERLPLLAEAIQRTADRPRRVLMDFAPASPASLDTFHPLSCRLRLLEFPELRQKLAKASDLKHFQALLQSQLPRDEKNPCNLILCWDYLNYLPRGPISLLMDEIAQHAQPGALVHMLIAYSAPLMAVQPCHFTPSGRDSVLVAPQCENTREAPRYAPKDLMRCMPRYKIDKAMLLRNGYQEYILQVRDEDDA
ncbi:MAG: hypothetical protein ACSHXK_07630 [Oceanococcus sp.]